MQTTTPALPANPTQGNPALVVAAAPAPPHMPDLFAAGKEFHLKEYESLKKEIGELVEHSRKLEIYALGGIAAFYAWYLSSPTPRTPKELLLIPVLVACLGALRSWSVFIRIGDIAKYLRKVEAALSLKDRCLLGWETHLKQPDNQSSVFVSSAVTFWLVVLLSSLVAKLVL